MKIAILSDIHSNPVAFKKCIDDAEKKGCERIVCLGDIVGYGYDPTSCIRICREKKILCIMGNHDAGLVGRLSLEWFSSVAKCGVMRQIPQVSEEDKKWLDNLPYREMECSNDGFAVAYAHGTFEFPGRFDYIQYYSDVVQEFPYLKKDGIKALFVGHTHFANSFAIDKNNNVIEQYIDFDDSTTINLEENQITIVNVGSCGYPRNQPYSAYCIYDDEHHTAKHQILDFDFDDYIAEMGKASISIPLWLESQKDVANVRRPQWR